MTVSLASLQKLMSLYLSTEQMAGVIEVLAVELAPLETLKRELEAKRAKDRDRKIRGKSRERSGKSTGVQWPVRRSRTQRRLGQDRQQRWLRRLHADWRLRVN